MYAFISQQKIGKSSLSHQFVVFMPLVVNEPMCSLNDVQPARYTVAL